MIDMLYLAFKSSWGLDETPLRLVHYTTTRMVLAFLTAFAITYAISPRVIKELYKRSMRDQVRDYGKEFSQTKSGTPTMGGLIIIAGILTAAALWCNPRKTGSAAGMSDLASAIPLLFMTLLFFGGVGAVDDYLKVKRGGADSGLSRRMKLLLQGGFASLFAVLVLSEGSSPFPDGVRDQLYLPGLPPKIVPPPELGVLYFGLIVVAFLCISNAINFADGLDGLAIVPSGMTALVCGVFAYFFSHATLASATQFAHLEGMTEVAVFAAAFLGAAVGFLWFNSYPAQVFMGDTGSMAIGGTLAALCVVTKTELLFLIAGGVFVYEFLSVFIQDVIGIRRIGKRLLLRAPAHHAFQYQGVAETKVVLRFWIVSFLLAVLSLATLKLR
ncbi:MAG: phospho-N-acetylmuramoyl-pentapeptide-transferase [Planctomycetota bacterium]|nr:phospho-N-acetylmuramoyl-pentapeptide-transferase [Planctomycetota bacterium]